MQPLPLTSPGAGVAFVVVVGVFALAEAVIRTISHRNAHGAVPGERLTLILVAASLVLGLGGSFIVASHLTAAAIPIGRWPIFIVGLVVAVCGIGLRCWSVAMLGRWFTIDVRVQEAQPVIDRGPYRFVRHPSYTGLLLTCVGIGLALGNTVALVVAVVPPAVALWFRIRVEEEALRARIGEAYHRYATGRARLIPHIW